MPKGSNLTPSEWMDRLMSGKTDIVRKDRRYLPSYMDTDTLIREVKSRGHILLMNSTHVIIIRGYVTILS